MSAAWPLFDLRLRLADLELRPLGEVDLPALAERLPDDVEQDPALPTYGGRTVALHLGYWRALGTWTPDAWRLGLVAHRSGELVGFQELQGTDFTVLRTVDSSSWLVSGARGQGVGKAMRQAVLALAFGPLEAAAAITSAWHDNAASLGVSRALGYLPNGVELVRRGEGCDLMAHLRLTRADWVDPGVEITGFDRCGPLFGL